MKNLIDRIQHRINTEKLIFSERECYTLDEIRDMVRCYSEQVCKYSNYMDLTFRYFSKILFNSKRIENEKEYKDDVVFLQSMAGLWYDKTDRKKEYDYDFITYFMENNIGYSYKKTYADFINDIMMDVSEIKKILTSKDKPLELNRFLCSNNFLMMEYPGFHSREDLEYLKTLTNQRKKDFLGRESYKNYKKVSKVTNFNIERYENLLNKKEAEKILMKKK